MVEELFNTTAKIKSSVSDETVELLASVKAKKDAKHFKNAKKEIDAAYKTLTDEAMAVTVSYKTSLCSLDYLCTYSLIFSYLVICSDCP